MAISFDEKNGVIIEDTSVIRSRVAGKWRNAFVTNADNAELNTDAETPAGQLIDGETALIARKDANLLYLANQFNPITATGMFQDALAKIYYIERKIAQPTYVTCECTGLQNVVIPYGAIVQSSDGYQFINTEATTISANGTASIIVRCSQTGAIEVPNNSINKIVTVVAGWDTVENSTAGVTGRAEETQAEFENRRAASVAKNSHGSAEAVKATLADITDVVAVEVLENVTNAITTIKGVEVAGHSVAICIYGGEDNDIASGIYNKLGAGCGTTGNIEVTYSTIINNQQVNYKYYILRPTAKSVSMNVTVVSNTANVDNLKLKIKNAILSNFNGDTANYARVTMGETLYASRFYPDVIALGIDQITAFTLTYNSTTATSVNINANEMPTIDANDITITIVSA